jgi:hypothetical protein
MCFIWVDLKLCHSLNLWPMMRLVTSLLARSLVLFRKTPQLMFWSPRWPIGCSQSVRYSMSILTFSIKEVLNFVICSRQNSLSCWQISTITRSLRNHWSSSQGVRCSSWTGHSIWLPQWCMTTFTRLMCPSTKRALKVMMVSLNWKQRRFS